MLLIPDIKLPFTEAPDKADLIAPAALKLRISPDEITKASLFKLSVVTGSDIYYKATVAAELSEALEQRLYRMYAKKGIIAYKAFDSTERVNIRLPDTRPVVVGFGPCGIFAALTLAKAGAAPIVLERGEETGKRCAAVETFCSGGELSEDSNILFGEGGAGAFSDGKLKIGFKDARKYGILSEFVDAGAPSEILYLDKPHIGSDRLHTVITALRKKIIALGGTIIFGARATDIIRRSGRVTGVKYIKNGHAVCIETSSVILAIGHSARDTFGYLHSDGYSLEPKSFGVGLRIEHPQELINKLIYGNSYGDIRLSAADYKLVTHLENGRSVYSFCMCPGGLVVPSVSERGMICTNGMSLYSRDGENANSALLVSVTPSDFGGSSSNPLAGIEYQRSIERAAFEAAGGTYKAPVCRLSDFISRNTSTEFGVVKPTYRPGTVFASPDAYLPEYITGSLRAAFYDMDKWMPGYLYPDALLTGPETRTTSPVRIMRNESMQSNEASGLYPCGEGAGYAGGIVSAAVDGIMAAEKILGINQ